MYNTINPKEQIPTYIHIDSIQFNANPALLGITKSHQITVAWVYYNNGLIGTYDLPATITVPMGGDSAGHLQVAPGIAINGLNNL